MTTLSTDIEEVRRLRRQIKYRDSQLVTLRAQVKEMKRLLDLDGLTKVVDQLRDMVRTAEAATVGGKTAMQVQAEWQRKWEHAWEEMGRAATRRGLCAEYDEVVAQIGGIPRPVRRRY